MTAKFTDTRTDSFEMQVFRELGEISSDVKSIKERLEKGDAIIEANAKEVRELPCKQAVSSCPDMVKPGGWGRPTAYVAGGGGVAAIIFGLIELAKQYLITKGV